MLVKKGNEGNTRMDKNQKILLGAILVVVLAMAVVLYPGDTGTTSCTPATKETAGSMSIMTA